MEQTKHTTQTNINQSFISLIQHKNLVSSNNESMNQWISNIKLNVDFSALVKSKNNFEIKINQTNFYDFFLISLHCSSKMETDWKIVGFIDFSKNKNKKKEEKYSIFWKDVKILLISTKIFSKKKKKR